MPQSAAHAIDNKKFLAQKRRQIEAVKVSGLRCRFKGTSLHMCLHLPACRQAGDLRLSTGGRILWLRPPAALSYLTDRYSANVNGTYSSAIVCKCE